MRNRLPAMLHARSHHKFANNSAKAKPNTKIFCRALTSDLWGIYWWKNRGSKISWHCPFKVGLKFNFCLWKLKRIFFSVLVWQYPGEARGWSRVDLPCLSLGLLQRQGFQAGDGLTIIDWLAVTHWNQSVFSKTSWLSITQFFSPFVKRPCYEGIAMFVKSNSFF
jgi:hypothetical protein